MVGLSATKSNLTQEKSMERLKIDNFLIIKAADIEIGKITVFIGPQASGKSIIAKLIYFFKDFISSTYLKSIENFETKKQLEKRGLSDFQQYFPKYTWGKQEFEIVYTIDEIKINISQKTNKQGKVSLKLDYSSELVKLHRKVKFIYKKRLLNENKSNCCLIDEQIEKCDYLFEIYDKVNIILVIYVELKGKDIKKAYDQLVSTIKYCQDKHNQFKKECHVVASRVPKAGTELQVLKKNLSTQYKIALYVHTQQAQVTI